MQLSQTAKCVWNFLTNKYCSKSLYITCFLSYIHLAFHLYDSKHSQTIFQGKGEYFIIRGHLHLTQRKTIQNLKLHHTFLTSAIDGEKRTTTSNCKRPWDSQDRNLEFGCSGEEKCFYPCSESNPFSSVLQPTV